jgi:hypothetical protein
MTEVGVDPGPAGLTVGPEAEDVDLALQSGIEVLVGLAPGIDRDLVQVGLPVPRIRVRGGPHRQRLQSLLGTR